MSTIREMMQRRIEAPFPFDWAWDTTDATGERIILGGDYRHDMDALPSDHAREYVTAVHEAQAAASEYMTRALTAYDDGRIDDSLRLAERAAACEAEFGDCPTYQDLVDALRACADEAEG